MTRRGFFAYAAGLPLGLLAACRAGGRRVQGGTTPPSGSVDSACPAPRAARGSGRALSPLERATLDAACVRLIPSDADAGAREAGVIDYIESQVTRGPLARHGKLLRRGARFLQSAARRQHGEHFARLPPAAQDALLSALQAGRLAGATGAAAFDLLLTLALEGYLGDPIYGGNRNRAGWAAIGFAPPAPSPRCGYEGLS